MPAAEPDGCRGVQDRLGGSRGRADAAPSARAAFADADAGDITPGDPMEEGWVADTDRDSRARHWQASGGYAGGGYAAGAAAPADSMPDWRVSSYDRSGSASQNPGQVGGGGGGDIGGGGSKRVAAGGGGGGGDGSGQIIAATFVYSLLLVGIGSFWWFAAAAAGPFGLSPVPSDALSA